MIDRCQILDLLISACPSFSERSNEGCADDWLDEQGNLLHYIALGDFARHLVSSFSAGRTEEFPSAFAAIEKLHTDGDAYVREAATIGILEGLQNIAGNTGVDPESFAKWLGPTSRQWWDRLNGFWNGERPFV